VIHNCCRRRDPVDIRQKNRRTISIVRTIEKRFVGAVACSVLILLGTRVGAAEPSVARGPDELFWVPTLEQALEMAKATGKPLFLMGYSLVPNGSTYTKIAPEYCSGVF
jgi:hypothetical protein